MPAADFEKSHNEVVIPDTAKESLVITNQEV